MSGQSITDRITAAQHSVTGSAVSKTVCKATTHEIMGPKKKHLDCKYQQLCLKLNCEGERVYSCCLVMATILGYCTMDRPRLC